MKILNRISNSIHHRSGILICFCTAVLLLCASCKGQEKKVIPEDKIVTQPEIESGEFFPSFISGESGKPTYDSQLPIFYEGQLCHWVRDIFQDSQGHLWFGTNHFGVMRYNGETLTYFSEENGLGGGRVNEISENKDGNVWLGTYGGLTRFDGQAFTVFRNEEKQENDEVWSIVVDDSGLLWLGTSGGVVQFDGEEFREFPIVKAAVAKARPHVSHDRITKIIKDKQGNIWFGTDGYGVTVYNGKEFSHFTTDNGLPDNNISDLLEDKAGNIWIATMYGGVSRYDGSTFRNFSKEGEISGLEAYGFFEDEKGAVWFSVEHEGVYRFDGTSFQLFDEEAGLISQGILSILKDRKGRFWLGGWKGLFRYESRTDSTKDEPAFVPVTRNGPWEYFAQPSTNN